MKYEMVILMVISIQFQFFVSLFSLLYSQCSVNIFLKDFHILFTEFSGKYKNNVITELKNIQMHAQNASHFEGQYFFLYGPQSLE